MNLATWLDQVLYRGPFEGASAHRYAQVSEAAFGDLHARLVDDLQPELAVASHLLEVGAGPATFARLAARAHPRLAVVALDPSRDFARRRDDLLVIRAAGEALPLADASIDLAICLSSIRHVRDRDCVLRELRRVVRPGGRLVIVELDPAASAPRIATHGDQLQPWWLRRSFGPLIVRTAPRAEHIIERARAAGWQLRARRDDTVQPVYILDLA